ncbi:MAG: VOC family protein [Hyphomonas sp.]|uniref:VOC family protein n=1 Tax=Hyphomonas sp. TaxID=87 RepID=UPI0034A01CDC
MSEFDRPKGLASALCYVDPNAAFLWLEEAFGFEPCMVLLDENDKIAHSEMSFGAGFIMAGSKWSENHKSPKNLGPRNSQTVHVQFGKGEDIDAHCERARKSVAEIVQEPDTQFYDDRTYRAREPEGHIWTFGVTLIDMSSADWDKASGGALLTKASLD